ncbi:ATP-binding protein [Streptomyces oceani]|uniref:Histidine kinase/HSP90-like ATPase domain-containing protein n=1 Tax=Streptomyces oceani TaxID=1075402 RepID=A0A1E7KQ30_9ACTN|nr:ATP-binding protein [Streptomyces oceani]OEV06040.1 hypothetical protein AN216_00790 [Streptomyces oceani]
MCPQIPSPAHPFVPPSPDFSLTFPPDPAWVRTCRETVRTSSCSAVEKPDSDRREFAELAALLASEAATNAITASAAAGCPYPITLYGEWLAEGGPFRIHVRDAAPGLPSVRHGVSDDEEHGRGLYLIASLASRYGTCADGPGPGKSFWFQLERTAGAP